MTRNFQIVAQCLAVIGQLMMKPSADLFGWTPELVNWLHAIVATAQGVIGVIAHFYNPDGTRSA